VVSSRGKCVLSCDRHSRFLDQGLAEIQKSMQKCQRGAAGGGQPVLNRASLLFPVPRQVPESRIAVERIAVAKKRGSLMIGDSMWFRAR